MLDDDVVFCRERVCPCDPSMPDLCEVEIKVGIFIPIVYSYIYEISKTSSYWYAMYGNFCIVYVLILKRKILMKVEVVCVCV